MSNKQTTYEQPKWMQELKQNEEERLPSLKLEAGQSAQFKFLDEGEEVESDKFGKKSIMFKIEHEGEQKVFFVSANNFSFLRDIKKLWPLIDRFVEVRRWGSGRTDTKYVIRDLNSD